jgi:hypothetical protein
MFCVDRLIHSKEAKGNNNEVEKEIQETPSHTVVVFRDYYERYSHMGGGGRKSNGHFFGRFSVSSFVFILSQKKKIIPREKNLFFFPLFLSSLSLFFSF